MRIKSVITSITLDDIDCHNTKIICNSASAIVLTMPASITSKDEADSEIDNVGTGDVTCCGRTVPPQSHAHLVHTGIAWDCVLGGGGSAEETDPVFSAWLSATPPVMSETDPTFNGWLIATPPVMNETDPDFAAWLAATPPVMSETDPVFSGSQAFDITAQKKADWDEAHTHAGTAHAPSDAQKNSDITKSEIEAKLIGTISTHVHPGGAGDATSLNGVGVPTPVSGDDQKYLKYDYATGTYVMGTPSGSAVASVAGTIYGYKNIGGAF